MSHDLSMADVRKMIRDMRREFNEKMDLLEARLRRRSPVRRAKITSARMTPALRDRILAMAEASPEATMHEIAAALEVNPGRVSEVLAGRRGEAEAPQPELQKALQILMARSDDTQRFGPVQRITELTPEEREGQRIMEQAFEIRARLEKQA